MGEVRPSLPSGLARRLDRLSVAAHRFHRFAHHPLCEEYAGEVFRLGRKTRICRGCTLAALGALMGLAAGAIVRLPQAWVFAGLAFGALPSITGALLLGGRPAPVLQPQQRSPEADLLSASHGVPPRRGKLLSRWLPTMVFATTLVLGLRTGGVLGAAGALLAVGQMLLVLIAYRRRGPQRRPCRTCPERFDMTRCRGFREIRQRERAFQHLAGRWIQSARN